MDVLDKGTLWNMNFNVLRRIEPETEQVSSTCELYFCKPAYELIPAQAIFMLPHDCLHNAQGHRRMLQRWTCNCAVVGDGWPRRPV